MEEVILEDGMDATILKEYTKKQRKALQQPKT